MKLFLASSGDKTISELKKYTTVGKRVLFIVNAADPYNIETWWIDSDRKAFEAEGFVLKEVDLRITTKEELQALLEKSDILHVCGGSVFYLIALLREKGHDAIIKEAIQQETIVYTGTSAGSIIVSESIRSFVYDKEQMEYIQKVPDAKGLGLLRFTVIPHANQAEFVKNNVQSVEHMPEGNTPLFFLHDNHALWVEDEKMELVVKKEK